MCQMCSALAKQSCTRGAELGGMYGLSNQPSMPGSVPKGMAGGIVADVLDGEESDSLLPSPRDTQCLGIRVIPLC